MTTPQDRNEIVVSVDKDGDWASIRIPEGYDAGMLTPDTLVTLARAMGVVVDASERDALESIITRYREGEGEVDEIFARATPPTRGGDGSVEWIEGFDPFETTSIEQDGSVDHYAANSMRLVNIDDHVANVISTSAGVEGRNVLGNTLPAQRGADAAISFHQKCFQQEEDGRVIALAGGVIRARSGVISIEEVYRVNGNVDFETGNIETPGDVFISGDVRDRFSVASESDVEILGLVEAATIECAGCLTLRTGMTGRGSGTFSVRGDADIGFLDSITGTIDGDLVLRREAIGCMLNVGGAMRGERAALIGGETSVSGPIAIGTLGSTAEAPTVMRVGALPMLEQELKRAKEDRAEAQRQLEALEREEDELKSMSVSLSPQQKERFTEIGFLRMESQQIVQTKAVRIEEIEKELDGRATVDLQIRSVIHPRVSIVTGTQHLTVPKPIKGPIRFSWSADRRLLIRRVDGKWYDAEATVRQAAA